MNGNWRTFSSASIGDLHLSCCILEQKIRLYVSQTTLSKTLIVGHSHVINRVIFVIFANENLAFWLWLLFAASLPLHKMSYCSSFCWFCSPPLLTNAKTPFALKPTGHTTINNNETWNRHFSACIKILLFIAVECSMDRVSIIFLVWIIDVLRFFFYSSSNKPKYRESKTVQPKHVTTQRGNNMKPFVARSENREKIDFVWNALYVYFYLSTASQLYIIMKYL